MNGEIIYNCLNPYKKPKPTTEVILERYEKHKAQVQKNNIKNAIKGNENSRNYFRDKIKPDKERYTEYKESKKKIYHLNNPPAPKLPVKVFN